MDPVSTDVDAIVHRRIAERDVTDAETNTGEQIRRPT